MNKRIVILLSLPFQILLYILLSSSSYFINELYSPYFFKPVSYTLRLAFGWIPFSLGEIVYYALLTTLVFTSIQALRKYQKETKERTGLLKTYAYNSVKYLSIFYLCYTWLWGFNYHRTQLAEDLQLNVDDINKTELLELSTLLIERTNVSRSDIERFSYDSIPISTISTDADEAYQKASKALPQLTLNRPILKEIFLSNLVSRSGLSGIYFPFTGEANFNTLTPRFKIPFVACHELAHQAGYASESEANFIAYLTCSASDNPYFRYAANYSAMSYSLRALHRADSTCYKELIPKISNAVQEDIEFSKRFYHSHKTPLHEVNHWFNDLFLKANNQKEGIKSYGLMNKLMIGEFRKNGLSRF